MNIVTTVLAGGDFHKQVELVADGHYIAVKAKGTNTLDWAG